MLVSLATMLVLYTIFGTSMTISRLKSLGTKSSVLLSPVPSLSIPFFAPTSFELLRHPVSIHYSGHMHRLLARALQLFCFTSPGVYILRVRRMDPSHGCSGCCSSPVQFHSPPTYHSGHWMVGALVFTWGSFNTPSFAGCYYPRTYHVLAERWHSEAISGEAPRAVA